MTQRMVEANTAHDFAGDAITMIECCRLAASIIEDLTQQLYTDREQLSGTYQLLLEPALTAEYMLYSHLHKAQQTLEELQAMATSDKPKGEHYPADEYIGTVTRLFEQANAGDTYAGYCLEQCKKSFGQRERKLLEAVVHKD